MTKYRAQAGFTLIELVIVIIIIGILTTVAVRKTFTSIETAKVEQTRREMDELAHAIAGNPGLYSSGSRTDFGYVGDVGALPPNLDALVSNPGDYATWDGPYMERGRNHDDYRTDAWGSPYEYTGSVIRSTGSGQALERVISTSGLSLSGNEVMGTLQNADGTSPGSVYRDSLLIRLTYPDGAGGMTIAATIPAASGAFVFSAIPVGNHRLEVVYLPADDTTFYSVTVLPGKTARLHLVSPNDIW